MEPTAKKPKNKKKIILIVIAAVLAVALGGCVYTAITTKPTLMGTNPKKGELKSEISTTGKVSVSELDEYLSTESTEVKKVYFKAGDSVKKGDLIVEFDNSSAMDGYKRAAITYEQTRLNLAETERKYFDNKEDIETVKEDIKFYEKKYKEYENYSDPENSAKYEKYLAQWQGAKDKKTALEKSVMSDEAVKSAQLSFELAKMNLDEATKSKNSLPKNIIAENDGIIEAIGVKDLSPAVKGTVAVAVRTANSDTVDFSIGRYDIGKILEEQTATVKVSGKEFTGTVSHIDPVASADSYIRAKIKLDSPDGIVPGVPADITIQTFYSENVLSVPIEAVKTDKTGDYCYVLKPIAGGKYAPTKTYIKIGNSSTTSIEVIEGLTEKDMLAANPPKGIETITVCNVIPLA